MLIGLPKALYPQAVPLWRTTQTMNVCFAEWVQYMDTATKQNKGSLSVWRITREQRVHKGTAYWIQGLY